MTKEISVRYQWGVLLITPREHIFQKSLLKLLQKLLNFSNCPKVFYSPVFDTLTFGLLNNIPRTHIPRNNTTAKYWAA